MVHILLAEDDPAIAEPLARALAREGHEVSVFNTGQAALDASARTDLAILDLSLPDLDGLALAQGLRSQSPCPPILVMTARADDLEQGTGADNGADDYITKPFQLAEMLARVRTLLRRTGAISSAPNEVVALDIRLDIARRRVFRGEQELHLTANEFDLLAALMRQAGQVAARSELLAEVWPSAQDNAGKTLDRHISWLRRKLGDDVASPHYISTIPGAGFRFEKHH